MTEEQPKDSPPVDAPMPDTALASPPVDAAPTSPPDEHEHGVYDNIDDENDKPDFEAEHTEENA